MTEVYVLEIRVEEPYGIEPAVTVHHTRDSVQREIDSTCAAIGIDVDVHRHTAAIVDRDEYGDIGAGILPNSDEPYLHWSFKREPIQGEPPTTTRAGSDSLIDVQFCEGSWTWLVSARPATTVQWTHMEGDTGELAAMLSEASEIAIGDGG